MHPYTITILTTVGLFLLFLLYILYSNKKRSHIARKKIQRLYGHVPDREYAPGDLDTISHYFRRKTGNSFYIDDITWNDLDMDRIYMLINQTMSSPGEDVLYSMLRMPLFDSRKTEEREKLICFFSDNPQKREKIQLMLSSVGKTWHGSVSDTILALDEAQEIHAAIHWLMFILLLSVVAVFPFAPVYCFLAFIFLSSINIVFYYAGRDRIKIGAYLDCFACLFRILQIAGRTESMEWPEIKKQMEQIKEGKAAFDSLKRKSFLITGKNDSTGDPLQILLDYLRMVFHLDILIYNSVLRDIKGKTSEIIHLLDGFGELDAAIAVASFREMLPLWCRPEFTSPTSGHIGLCAENLYHPLIREPVSNSISARSGILITGSNASGKSTFLKNIAINSILAQTVLTCTCTSYRAPFLKVMTSMALRDDLSVGESYFIVEIKSLKRILDESKKEEPLLCVIDEVLRGTNTIERIAASSRILNALDHKWVLPMAATHDIELSYILEKIYENYHFEETVLENQVVFNYLLQRGRTTTRNALRLLKLMDYDPEIVENSARAAADFESDGFWKEITFDKGVTRNA